MVVLTGDFVISHTYDYGYVCVHEPLRWVGRVPRGQKSFLTYTYQLEGMHLSVPAFGWD